MMIELEGLVMIKISNKKCKLLELGSIRFLNCLDCWNYNECIDK